MNSTIYNIILFEEYMLRLVTIIQYIICTRVCVCVCVCVSEYARTPFQSYLTLDYSPPGSSVHGIL